jgi:hypothetical protein
MKIFCYCGKIIIIKKYFQNLYYGECIDHSYLFVTNNKIVSYSINYNSVHAGPNYTNLITNGKITPLFPIKHSFLTNPLNFIPSHELPSLPKINHSKSNHYKST